MDDLIIKELTQLSKNEKLLLVEALWDSIISDPEQLEVSEHHKTILEQRLRTLEQDKKDGASWEEIKGKYK